VYTVFAIFTLLHPFLISSPFPMVPNPRQDLPVIPALGKHRQEDHKFKASMVNLIHYSNPFTVYMYLIIPFCAPSTNTIKFI
jgi:hypothetical protein